MSFTISFIATRLSLAYLMTMVSILQEFLVQLAEHLKHLSEISQSPNENALEHDTSYHRKLNYHDLHFVMNVNGRIWTASNAINRIYYASMSFGLLIRSISNILFMFQFALIWFNCYHKIVDNDPYFVAHWISLIFAILAFMDVLAMTVIFRRVFETVS